MDLINLLSDWRPRWSTQGNVVMDCPFLENHTHRVGSGKHSLTVWPGIQAYKCYSCGKGGPVLKLLTEKLDLDYFSAVEALNELPDLEERQFKGFELDRVLDLTPPKVYLDRNFPPELLKKYRVGKGTYMDAKKRERKATIIPLYDQHVLKGLQYRVETPDGKMVWNTDGFDSAGFLYNYRPAEKVVTLVEGYADVWRMDLYGYHAEGTLGTSITDGKMALLKNRDIVYVALDNDMPGIRATEKVYLKLRDYVELRFVPYRAKDPDATPKRQIMLGHNKWLDYGAYSYQRMMEFEPDTDDGENWYLKTQEEERKRYERQLESD